MHSILFGFGFVKFFGGKQHAILFNFTTIRFVGFLTTCENLQDVLSPVLIFLLVYLFVHVILDEVGIKVFRC